MALPPCVLCYPIVVYNSAYSNPLGVVVWSQGFSRIRPPKGSTPFHNQFRIAICRPYTRNAEPSYENSASHRGGATGDRTPDLLLAKRPCPGESRRQPPTQYAGFSRLDAENWRAVLSGDDSRFHLPSEGVTSQSTSHVCVALRQIGGVR